MDVTIQNYKLIRDEFVAQCATCEFYAIDQEMTGINATGQLRDVRHNFGSQCSAHYPCSRSAAESYCAFQIGICFYHKVSGSPSAEDAVEGGKPQPVHYEARPYNFWLRPQAFGASGAGNNGGDGVMLNMSGVDFLLSNSMDFQYWLRNGMPYCTPEDAKKIRSKLECSKIPDLFDLHPETSQWVGESLEAIKEWILSSAPSGTAATLTLPVPQAPTGISPKGLQVLHHIVFSSIRPASRAALEKAELVEGDALHTMAQHALNGVSPSSSTDVVADASESPDSPTTTAAPVVSTASEHSKAILRLIPFFLNLNSGVASSSYFQASPRLDAEVPNQWRLPKAITFSRFASKDDSDAYEGEHDADIQEKVRDATGFLPFFEALIACQKPQIGHNYSSDLMFMINQHHMSPLPSNLVDFTKCVSQAFPQVYDTKTLSGNMPEGVSNTSLGALYESLCKRMVQRFGGAKGAVARKGNTGDSSASAMLQLRLPTGFEGYSSFVAPSNGGGAGGGTAVAHQGAYDAFMTGVIYLQLQLLYGHRTFVAPHMGWISMFGCPYSFCVHPDPSIVGTERLMIQRGYTVGIYENDKGAFVGVPNKEIEGGNPTVSFPSDSGISSKVVADRIVATTNAAIAKLLLSETDADAESTPSAVNEVGVVSSPDVVVKVRASFQPEPEWKQKHNKTESETEPSILRKKGSWIILVSVATISSASRTWTRVSQRKLLDEIWTEAQEKVAVLGAVTDCLVVAAAPTTTDTPAVAAEVADEGAQEENVAVTTIAVGSPEWASLRTQADTMVAVLPSGIVATKAGGKRERSD